MSDVNNILVLDDDEDICSVVKLIFTMNNYKCNCITNYKDLDKAIKTYKPTLIIMDISLGGADGRELCKRIKNNKETSNIQVILFSANQDVSRTFENYKASEFIAKPFDSKNLIMKVEKTLIAAA